MTSLQDLIAKYPSLKKLEEAGDDFQEWKDGREQRLLFYIRSHPQIDQIKNNPSKLLNAIDDFANNEDFLISIGPDKATKITQMLQDRKPNVIVELGGYLGYSAILFASELRKYANDPDASEGGGPHIWSLEFEPDFAKIAQELIDIAGLSDLVTVIVGSAADSLRKMNESKQVEHIDFLFLDHVEDLYKQDLQLCEDLGLLRAGAMVVADNVVRPGAPEYREYVRSSEKYESHGVKGLIMPGEFEDEIEVSTCL